MYIKEKLPYEFDSLEPYIDTHTLGLHYNKHLQNYLNKLNDILIKNNYDFKYKIDDLYTNLNDFPVIYRSDILYNLGGVLNHYIYFLSMSPNKVLPNNELLNEINIRYGSFDNFKKEFKEKAMSLNGAGYTFLVVMDGYLNIVNFTNQDCPLFYNMIPLIGIDMWEHAYYINYENKKEIYIDNFFDVIDFSEANNKFNKNS